MKYRKDIVYLFLLLIFGLVFWGEALAPGKLLFLRDLSIYDLANKHFLVDSHGFALWNPFVLFGSPYALPSSGAFYPLNFLFLIFGAERGLTYFVIFHHLFFLLTFYLALRRVGYREEASLLGSVGFSLGGYLVSTTLLIFSLSTFVWLGLSIILLYEAQGKRWLISSLLLGLTMALQILGGGIESAAMSWVLAFLTVVTAPARVKGPAALVKLLGAMLLGLFWGIILALPQIAINSELLPISNRARGIHITKALFWSLPFSNLKSLFIPNYFLDFTAGDYRGLGFLSGDAYFSSFYLAASLLPFSIFGLAGSSRWKCLVWFAVFLFGLAMMMGDQLGLYGLFHDYFPGFKMFRIPQKFLLLVNYAFVLISIGGFEVLISKKWSFPLASLICFLDAIAIIVLFLVYPLKIEGVEENYLAISAHLLLRSCLWASLFFLIMLGLILGTGKFSQDSRGILFALVVFLDLFFAHHWLNRAVTPDFFQPDPFIQEFLANEKDRIVPPRIYSFWPEPQRIIYPRLIPFEVFEQKYRDSPKALTAVYFGYNSLQGLGTLFPRDVTKFSKLLKKSFHYQQLLARAGVEYLYDRFKDFKKLSDVLPRAAVYHRVQTLAGQDRVIELWSRPDFPAAELLLIEGEPESADPGPGAGRPEAARIIEYENERVAVEASAQEAGWLLLLDSYYPGWEAEVDGVPARIYRADGFFRAVPIPAGRHRVVFRYSPAVFWNSVRVSGIGLLVWAGLAVLGYQRSRKREETASPG